MKTVRLLSLVSIFVVLLFSLSTSAQAALSYSDTGHGGQSTAVDNAEQEGEYIQVASARSLRAYKSRTRSNIEDSEDDDSLIETKKKKRKRKKKKRKKKEEEFSLESLPPLVGPKKVVMVGDIANKAGGGSQAAIGDPLEEMLTEALMKSGRFIVTERPQIEAGLAEQDFAQSGRTSAIGTPQIGKITNAQIMITGAITEFDSASGGSQQSIGYGGFGIGFSQAKAHVAVIIRLVDLTTMQVIDSQRVEGTAKAGGATFSYHDSGGWGGSLGGFKKTPIGKACQSAINQALLYIIRRMDSIPWQGAIAMKDQFGIIINNGGENGIKIGDKFTVFRKGTEIVDPATGVSLGSRKQRMGIIEIVSVDPKFSTAAPVEGSNFEIGDIISYIPPPPPPPPPPLPPVIVREVVQTQVTETKEVLQ